MPDRPVIRRHRGVLSVIGVGHLVIAGLALIRRSGYTVEADHALLQAAADNHIWVVLHIACAVGLGFLVVKLRHRSWLMNFSATVMMCWSLILLAWGIDAARPVSLLGPVLGLISAATTLALSHSLAPDD